MTIAQKINASIRDVPNFPKEGILFKDIAPILANPALCKEITRHFCDLGGKKPDAICVIESRGFFFGMSMATLLDVPLIMIRKKGKLPGEVIAEEYDLEYGSATIEIQKDSLHTGQKVWLHDDVLATGGTARAAVNLIHRQGAELTSLLFLMELSFLQGVVLLEEFGVPIHSLVRY